jgi:hypothetical protein
MGLHMRQGAFTTQPVEQDLGPTEGPEDFLSKLAGVMKPEPVVSRETPLEGLSALARMTAQPAPRIEPPKPRMEDPAPGNTGFLPGKPGVPRSGMTVHQIMKDPDVLTTVQNVVAEFEKANPGRMLKGTHLQAGLTAKGLDVSSAQAAKIAKRIKDEHDKMVQQQVAAYSGRAAKKVLG